MVLMADEQKDVDKPFHVVVMLNGEENFVAGFLNFGAATAEAERRDVRAEEMGLKSRYEARTGSWSERGGK